MKPYSRDSRQGHKVQKHIEGDRVTGASLHSTQFRVCSEETIVTCNNSVDEVSLFYGISYVAIQMKEQSQLSTNRRNQRSLMMVRIDNVRIRVFFRIQNLGCVSQLIGVVKQFFLLPWHNAHLLIC